MHTLMQEKYAIAYYFNTLSDLRLSKYHYYRVENYK